MAISVQLNIIVENNLNAAIRPGLDHQSATLGWVIDTLYVGCSQIAAQSCNYCERDHVSLLHSSIILAILAAYHIFYLLTTGSLCDVTCRKELAD